MLEEFVDRVEMARAGDAVRYRAVGPAGPVMLTIGPVSERVADDLIALQALRHPRLAPFDAGVEGDNAFVLGGLPVLPDPIDEPTALSIVSALAEAVDYLHRRHIVHGAVGRDAVVFDGTQARLTGLGMVPLGGLDRDPSDDVRALGTLLAGWITTPSTLSGIAGRAIAGDYRSAGAFKADLETAIGFAAIRDAEPAGMPTSLVPATPLSQPAAPLRGRKISQRMRGIVAGGHEPLPVRSINYRALPGTFAERTDRGGATGPPSSATPIARIGRRRRVMRVVTILYILVFAGIVVWLFVFER